MSSNKWKFIFIPTAMLLTTLAIIGCSKDKSQVSENSLSTENTLAIYNKMQANKNTSITVVDSDNKPLANAKVLIGMAINNPFPGNLLVTSATGQVQIPAAWNQPQALTVHLDGYTRVTYFGQQPGPVTIVLKKIPIAPKYELAGATSGMPIVDNDGLIDFGVIVSALTRNDLLAFDISKVLSFRTDKVNFAGTNYDIPSNISIPKQRESYVVPVSIEKLAYRIHFTEKDSYRIFGARGRFPFKDVVEELSTSSFYELINYFSISGGVIRDIQIVGDRTVLDLPVGELTFTNKMNFKAPAMASDEVMITVAAADLNGYMIPTDIKKLVANEAIGLTTHSTAKPLIIGVIKNKSEFTKEGADRFTAVILPLTAGLTPKFLNQVAAPVINGNRLTFTKPAAVTGVNPLATLSIYSEVKEVPYGNTATKIPFVTRLWEVYTPNWVENVTLPVWPTGSPQPSKKIWEVAYIGSQLKNTSEMGQAVIDAATHITHNSSSF